MFEPTPKSIPRPTISSKGWAFGAHAEKLVDPADVPAALERCVSEGRLAMLHVRVTPL